MKFELSDLSHTEQMRFLELVRHRNDLDDGFYKVFYDRRAKEFLLSRIDAVIKDDR